MLTRILSNETLTWVATVFIALLAYILGAVQYRPVEPRDADKCPSEVNDRAVASGKSLHGTRGLAALRTKDSAAQAHGDSERVSPSTPAPHRAVSPLGRAESCSELVEPVVGKERLVVDKDVVEGCGAVSKVHNEVSSPRVRKLVPKQTHEFAVVQYREAMPNDGDVVVREEVPKVMETNKVSSGSNMSEWASTPPPVAPMCVPLSRMRTTSDGIPVVDVSDGSYSGGGKGSTTNGSMNAKSYENPSAVKALPSRTNSGKKERVSVTYKGSPNSPGNRTPFTHKKRSGVSDRTYVSRDGHKGGSRTEVTCGKQQHSMAAVPSTTFGREKKVVRGVSAAHVAEGYPITANRDPNTSPISTIGNITPVSSPTHRREESENTKLEGAWMTANMAAAELGLGPDDSPMGAAKNADVRENVKNVWEKPWAQVMNDSTGDFGPSAPFNMVSHGMYDDDKRSQEPSNYGLDLYSSLSSLSWANSSSLSSFGSSLQRTASTAERTDVFDTIKSIWGEQPNEERRLEN
jgi:hypothetical protein